MDFHARKINLFRAVSAAIIKISSGLIAGLLLFLQYSDAATIQISSVNSTGCTLVDAIKSANANNASGTTCATSTIGLFGDDIILFPVIGLVL